MSAFNKTIHNIAGKLGIEECKVLSKATEYGRFLQNRSLAGSNMTDTSKLVVCLDLACELYNIDLNMKIAAVYSGLKPSGYKNSRKIIQNLLELNTESINISTLCVSLNCSAMQTQAEKILLEYQKHSKQTIDLNLPQYICMAVYHACRLNKVKVSKSKLIEKSRLKPAQWTKLDTEWAKFVSDNFVNEIKPKVEEKVASTADDLKTDLMDTRTEETVNEENVIEDYEIWKARVLELAYKDLGISNKPIDNDDIHSQKFNIRKKIL